MTRTKLAALLTALVPLACSGSDETDAGRLGQPPRFAVPGCKTLDHSACDVRTTLCQTRLLELAACLRGDEPGALPGRLAHE